MAIEWSKKLETGFEEIDNHHKTLVELMNKLEGAVQKKGDNFKNDVLNIFSELKNFTIMHFSVEEFLMKMFKYDDSKSHFSLHSRFVNIVKEQQERIIGLFRIAESEKETEAHRQRALKEIDDVLSNLNEFLKRWIIKHILEEDHKYVPHFKEIFEKANKKGWLSFLK